MSSWAHLGYLMLPLFKACTPGAIDLVPAFFPAGQGLVCVDGNTEDVFEHLKLYQTLAVLEVGRPTLGAPAPRRPHPGVMRGRRLCTRRSSWSRRA